MYAPLVVSSTTQNPKKVGMGTYLTSNWVTPERYTNPLGGATVQIPSGWGAASSHSHSHAKKGMGCSCGCGGGSGCSENGMGDWTDPSTWGVTEWGTILGGGAVLLYLMKQMNKKRRTRRAIRRVKGY
jgi:hypothetical protein